MNHEPISHPKRCRGGKSCGRKFCGKKSPGKKPPGRAGGYPGIVTTPHTGHAKVSNQNGMRNRFFSLLVHGMTQHHMWQRAYVPIGVGMLIIFAAQFWASLPVVTAIALVGRGAIQTLRSRLRTSRQDSLIVLNLSVYGTLICLAIVAQSNVVMQMSAERVSLAMLLDHAAAIVLLVGLIYGVFVRLCQPAA